MAWRQAGPPAAAPSGPVEDSAPQSEDEPATGGGWPTGPEFRRRSRRAPRQGRSLPRGPLYSGSPCSHRAVTARNAGRQCPCGRPNRSCSLRQPRDAPGRLPCRPHAMGPPSGSVQCSGRCLCKSGFIPVWHLASLSWGTTKRLHHSASVTASSCGVPPGMELGTISTQPQTSNTQHNIKQCHTWSQEDGGAGQGGRGGNRP